MIRYDRERKQYGRLEPSFFLEDNDHTRVISALLEGVILEKRDESKGQTEHSYPVHSPLTAKQIVDCDCSSWQEEFCIVTQRSAAIYSPPFQRHQVIFPSGRVQYADYWNCVIRGLEFALETKTLAQVAERNTSSQLEHVLPLLMGDRRQVKLEERERFIEHTSNSARLIAQLRTITVPELISRASYATSKFELFNRQTALKEIVAHAEANLRALAELLERHSDLELQIESQRTNEVGLLISLIFASLTLAIPILSLPSFVADWKSQEQWFMAITPAFVALPWLGFFLIAALLAVGMTVLGFGIPVFVRTRMRRKRRFF